MPMQARYAAIFPPWPMRAWRRAARRASSRRCASSTNSSQPKGCVPTIRRRPWIRRASAVPCPSCWTSRKCARLIEAARAMPAGAERSRIVLLLELLYGAGLRVSELVGLPLAAVLRQAKVLVLRGKGGKERMVPLGEPVRAALADYLAERDFFLVKARPSPWLFRFPRRQGAPDAPAPDAAAQIPGAGGGNRAIAAQPPCAAPCFRHTFVGSRRRSAQRAEDAGPCRHRHDANLYPCRRRPAEPAGGSPPSACRQGAAETGIDDDHHARRD